MIFKNIKPHIMFFSSVLALNCVSNTCSDVDNPDCITFKAVIRDFPQHAFDFESPIEASGYPQKGLLNGTIDNLGRPVFSPYRLRSKVSYGTEDFTSAAALVNYGSFLFDQYYMDVPKVNIPYEIQINLTKRGNGYYTYDSNENTFIEAVGSTNGFFPLDGAGFAEEFYGNQGHNYWYTTHVSYPFFYRGGETFQFSGDDDLYIFVNKKLVTTCDLGGIHQKTSCDVNFDSLNLVKNVAYQLDVYHADRHTIESNFKVTTSVLPRNIAPVSQNNSIRVSGLGTSPIRLNATDANDDKLIVTIYPPYPKYGTIKYNKLSINNGSRAAKYEISDTAFDFAAGSVSGSDMIYYTVSDNCVETKMYELQLNVSIPVTLFAKPHVRDNFTQVIDEGQTLFVNVSAWDEYNYTLYYLDDIAMYQDLWKDCINVVELNQTSGIMEVQGIRGECDYTYRVSNKYAEARGEVKFHVNCKTNCFKRSVVTIGGAGPTNEVVILGNDPITSISYLYSNCNNRRFCHRCCSHNYDCCSHNCMAFIYQGTCFQI
eukprot:NODE_188_length_13518_cov_0.721142.p2 type:complete len:541 gc:universal NODE_188_length_13518_cov_0.721142:1082-2704(+)